MWQWHFILIVFFGVGGCSCFIMYVSLKLAFYFITVEYVPLKNVTTYIQFRAPTLIHAKTSTALPSIAFAPSLQISTQWKGQTTYFFSESGFFFVDTLKVSWIPWSPWTTVWKLLIYDILSYFPLPQLFIMEKLKFTQDVKKNNVMNTIFLYLDWPLQLL